MKGLFDDCRGCFGASFGDCEECLRRKEERPEMRLINAHDVVEHAEVNGEDPEFIRKLMDYLAEAPTVEPLPRYIRENNIVRHYENGMVAMNKPTYFELLKRYE